MTFVPIIDISRYQAGGDFTITKSKGVQGVVIRAGNGGVEDPRFADNLARARAGGFTDHALGCYSFVNPKRIGPVDGANRFAELVRQRLGHLDTFLMLDIESFVNETPNAGSNGGFGLGPLARYLNDFLAQLRAVSAPARVIGYSNDGYWARNVADPLLAAELDWIVPRYPVYSTAGYAAHPLPVDPALWDEWAFAREPAGPTPPKGAHGWAGWQFSAGYNHAAATYGFPAGDLDLNIIRPDAWARWTGQPAEGDDMARVSLIQDSTGVYATGDFVTYREVSPEDIQFFASNGLVDMVGGIALVRPVPDDFRNRMCQATKTATKADLGDIVVPAPVLKPMSGHLASVPGDITLVTV